MNIIQQKDTTFTKIFVGGLPYHTTDKTLREFFQQFGDIEEAVVITDRQTGKSRGYGFVTMSDRKSTEQACLEPNPIIDGRKANVNLAYLGAKPRIPATEILASGLHFGLKTSALTLPGYLAAGQMPMTTARYPQQYIYPYLGLSAAAPVSPFVSTAPYLDYSAGTGLQPTGYTTFQISTAPPPGSPTGYEMTAINGFSQNGAFLQNGSFSPTTVSFAALPHQGHYASHFQPAHQIQ